MHTRRRIAELNVAIITGKINQNDFSDFKESEISAMYLFMLGKKRLLFTTSDRSSVRSRISTGPMEDASPWQENAIRCLEDMI
jgi:hypothetical protein